jgi:hypothetical protein
MNRASRLIGFILCWTAYMAAQCPAPHYSKGMDFSSEDLGSVYISIRPQEFVPTKLICLAQVINENHPKWKKATVLMFTTPQAARNFRDPGQECAGPCQAWANQLHALYVFDRAQKVDELSIMPLGYGTKPADTSTIKLPRSGTVHCALELYDRCLIAAKDPSYSQETLKSDVSGRIALSGTLTPQGRILDIHVTAADVNPPDKEAFLTKQSVQNLASWRVEPAQDQRSIEISYSYVIDKGLERVLSEVTFELPDRIIIRGNPEPLK